MDIKKLKEQIKDKSFFSNLPGNSNIKSDVITVDDIFMILNNSESSTVVGYASEAVPGCGDCANNKLCEMYRIWKGGEYDYFGRDITDFSCKHFIASKPEA